MEKEIEKVLDSILMKEQAIARRAGIEPNIAINKHIIQDVKVKCNKDMRGAIQLLQFYMQGRVKEARSHMKVNGAKDSKKLLKMQVNEEQEYDRVVHNQKK